jgi:hypothetical protein
VRLDIPPVGDPVVAERLALASADLYGRPALDVELDLEAAADRIRGAKVSVQPEELAHGDGVLNVQSGGTSAARSTSGGEVPGRARTRTHRKGNDRNPTGSSLRTSTDEPQADANGEGTAA